MQNRPKSHRFWRTAALATITLTALVGSRIIFASDHQDTPEVELNPRMDVNDVYAFPGSTNERIALILTTSSPIAGNTASFDPDLLYQVKVDNNGDAVEDLVFQITFDDGAGTSQRYTVRGPVAPTLTGTQGKLITSGMITSGMVGSNSGSTSSIQAFAGLRADPFVVDLEQFFKILPDRRPSTGPLSTPSTQTATAFRTPGVDFLQPFNTLAIAVELPKAMLVPNSDAASKIGVWATISR